MSQEWSSGEEVGSEAEYQNRPFFCGSAVAWSSECEGQWSSAPSDSESEGQVPAAAVPDSIRPQPGNGVLVLEPGRRKRGRPPGLAAPPELRRLRQPELAAGAAGPGLPMVRETRQEVWERARANRWKPRSEVAV